MSKKPSSNKKTGNPLRARKRDLRDVATDVYMYLMLLVFPLFTWSNFADITTPKEWFFYVVTGLWVLSLVVLSFVEGPPAGFFTLPRVCALAFAGLCVLSWLLSDYRAESLIGHRNTGLVPTLLLVCVYLGVSRFGHVFERHLLAFGASMTLLSLLCVIQVLGGDPFDLYGIETYYQHASYMGTIGNVDTLSAVMSLAVPAFLAFSVKRPKPYDDVYLVPLFFSAVCLALARAEAGVVGVLAAALVAPIFLVRDVKDLRRTLTGAALALAGFALGRAFHGEQPDGPEGQVFIRFDFGGTVLLVLALAVVCGLAAWLLGCAKWDPPPRAFVRFFSIAAGAVVVAGVAAVWFWPGESGTVWEASQLMHGNWNDHWGNGRMAIWRITLTNFPERPLLGGGPGTLYLRQVAYFPDSDVVARLAHNVYLQYLIDTGLLGLLAYLAMMATALFARRREAWKTLLLGALLASIAYLVNDFFNLGVIISSPLLYVFLGYLQMETHLKPKKKQEKKPVKEPIKEKAEAV